jgi:hypothetical protein
VVSSRQTECFDAEPLVVAEDAEVPISETIVTTAKERGSLAVVLGQRVRGRLQEAFLGDTSRDVIRRAPCPVVVTRHAGGERHPLTSGGAQHLRGDRERVSSPSRTLKFAVPSTSLPPTSSTSGVSIRIVPFARDSLRLQVNPPQAGLCLAGCGLTADIRVTDASQVTAPST